MARRYYFFATLFLAGLMWGPSASAQTYAGYMPVDDFLTDLDFRDGHLWALHRSSGTPRIHRINPVNGQIVSTINLNIDFTPHGMTWDGSHFRVSRSFTSSNNRIYRIGTDGNIVDDIPAPSPLSNGLAWNDGYLWVSRAHPNEAAAHVRLDPDNGGELQAIPSPETQPAGMAFIGDGTFWATNAGDNGTNIHVLYQVDIATGAVLTSLGMPDGVGRPRGLAYDGEQYLYMIAQKWTGPTNYRIYVVDLLSEGNAVLSLSATSLSFGTVLTNDVQNRTLVLTNTGNAELVIEDVQISGSDAFGTAFNGAGIQPGEQVSAVVSFEPDAYGPHSATLSFTSNDVSQPTVSIPLSGFGLFPEQTAALVSTDHDFGSVRIAHPYDRSVRTWPMQVVNQGATALQIEILETSGDFHIESDVDLPVTLGAADTLRVMVGFRPLATGPSTGEARAYTSDTDNAVLVASLSGTGVNPDLDGGDPIWTLLAPDNPNVGFQDKKVSVIRPIGDVTGDGTPDLVVGVRNYLVHAVRGNSWGTGEILWSFNTCLNNFNCGAVSGSDGLFNTGLISDVDLNGDGYMDVVFATGGGNDHVYALSGKDGTLIWAHGDVTDPYLATYQAVSARYDFTGDGIPDVAAVTGTASQNSPNPYNQRRVYLLSGATGEVVWVRQPNPAIPNFGVEQIMGSDGSPLVIAGGRAGEINQGHVTAYNAAGSLVWTHSALTTPFLITGLARGDGADDVIYTGSTGSGNSLVRLDGQTGEIVWSLSGLGTVWAIDILGDVTGSGTPDIVIGDTFGNVTVYDGASGSFVWNAGMPGQAFGISATADITLDGNREIAVATSNGQIRLLSGADGQTLWTYQAGNGTIDQAAEVVALIPDVDGNNAPEVAAGTRHGRVLLLKTTGDVLPVSTDGDGSPLAFRLDAPYPNPTAEGATFTFELPEATTARMAVFDLLGRQVAVLFDGERPAGTHEWAWSGRSAAGAPVAAGLYLIRLDAGMHSATQRLLIVR